VWKWGGGYPQKPMSNDLKIKKYFPLLKFFVGNSCVKGREVKCFNTLARGEGPGIYVL
jgi:hypothetical protein